MSQFRNDPGAIPAWCELEFFDIVRLSPRDVCRFDQSGAKELLFVVTGRCLVRRGNVETERGWGDVVDLGGEAAQRTVCEAREQTTLVRIGGHWGDEIGSCGVFELANAETPCNVGDPASYPRTTQFDNHYHDCDEYWIMTEGRCIAVSGGRTYHLGPGDCLATKMGEHHDIPCVIEPLRGVYFEGTLGGKKRLGHLWGHRDGRESRPA